MNPTDDFLFTYEISYTVQNNYDCVEDKDSLKIELEDLFEGEVEDLYSTENQQTLFGIRTNIEPNQAVKIIKSIFSPDEYFSSTEISIHLSIIKTPAYNLKYRKGRWEKVTLTLF